jgi:hypothetical protein
MCHRAKRFVYSRASVARRGRLVSADKGGRAERSKKQNCKTNSSKPREICELRFLVQAQKGTVRLNVVHESYPNALKPHRFYRGKDKRHRVSGTGIGLPIAKAILEAYAGTIKVSSKHTRPSSAVRSRPAPPVLPRCSSFTCSMCQRLPSPQFACSPCRRRPA